MISFPMEARVVHLQLLVALTAQRLCALNLQTEKHKHKMCGILTLEKGSITERNPV